MFPDVTHDSHAPDALATATAGPLLIAGSIATDHLMTFGGKFADSLVESMPTKPRQISRPDGPVIPMMLPQRAGAGTSPGRS